MTVLPDAQRRGDIKFLVAKGLSYDARLRLAFALAGAGIVLQVLLLQGPFWLGLPLVAGGAAMLLTAGYSNVPERQAGGESWRPARREEVQRILEIQASQRRWDADAVDITCGRGFAALALLGIAVGSVALLAAAVSARLSVFVAANTALGLLPFWLTGVRSVLKNDRLATKAKLLIAVEDHMRQFGLRDGEELQYQIQTAKASGRAGETPTDLKAILSMRDAGPGFLGVQIQIATNSVQGSDYPYLYCVLVARPEFPRIALDDFEPVPRKTTVEVESGGDMQIAVVRCETTKTSGYHTPLHIAEPLVDYAVSCARRLVDRVKA